MAGPLPTIIGFASNNRVPGVYGETVYGAGGISASSIPLSLLVVGTSLAAGSAAQNASLNTILSANDADTFFGAGSEIARQCYAALKVPGVLIKAAPLAEAGGAVAAVQVITIGGSWTTTGQLTFRVNGETISLVVGSTDTIANVCTNIAAAFNNDPRRGYSAATTGTTQVSLTVRSKGARGNQYVTFQDTTLAPSGLTSVIAGSTWVTLTAYTAASPISFAVPTVANGFYYKCTTGGTTAASQPTWPTTIGGTVVDGTVTWTCWGNILTGGLTNWGGGTGTETATAMLAYLLPQGFDRIALAENDATNLALWVTQLNAQAGPTSNMLQHLVTAVTGTLAAATTLATVTMNSPRQQLMWYLNSETVPWEISAYFAAFRTASEQTDPASAYDDLPLINVAPQSQRADWPSNATLQSAVNNGISPVYTSPTGAQALVCISITSHSLTGSTPDYRTFNTSDAYVPDFVRRDIGLFWSTVYKPANPRVADDPQGDQKPLVAGVATPLSWSAVVEKKLRDYEKGILASSGTTAANPNVAPIITNVDNNKPNSGFDPVAKRIMSTIPVVPIAPNHQLGISVRQLAA